MTLALFLILFAILYLTTTLFVFAKRRPAYSHIRHTISELGEFGSSDQRLISLGIFLPIGFILLISAYLLQPQFQPTAILALSIAIGYLIAALFPCDAGSPMIGSLRQALHNGGGAVEYLCGGGVLLHLAETFGQPFGWLGMTVFMAIIGISFPNRLRGLIQRVAEVCLFGGLVLAIWIFQETL